MIRNMKWKFRFFKTIQHAEGQTRMLRENNVDTMAVDALTPCVISSSATRGPNQYKDVILQYRKSHCGDKTILRPSYLHYLPPILVRWHLYIESGPKVLIMQDKRALAFHQEGSQLSQSVEKLTHWRRDKMDAISQTTFWSTFSWMKML